jgi:hypothetical protein
MEGGYRGSMIVRGSMIKHVILLISIKSVTKSKIKNLILIGSIAGLKGSVLLRRRIYTDSIKSSLYIKFSKQLSF